MKILHDNFLRTPLFKGNNGYNHYEIL